jgi:transcriptional regulator with XRE-family HTH domain
VQYRRKAVTGDEVGDQAAFARRMGIDIRSWNNYERGHPIPRDQALALSVRTGVSLDWLFVASKMQ